jgi:hypothetical protein
MLNYIFTYLFIGVVFNFLFDLIINYIESEEHRFTLMERLMTTLLWPIAFAVFVFNFIKTLIGK